MEPAQPLSACAVDFVPDPEAPWLICTALGIEAHAVRRGVGINPGFEILCTGMGPRAAAQGIANRLQDRYKPRPAGVVGSGVAGAFGGGFALGECVVAERLLRRYEAPLMPLLTPVTVLAEGGVPARSVVLMTVDEVNHVPPCDGAIVVDMESYLWAQAASRMGLPFGAVRVVSDTPEHPFPRCIAPWTAFTQTQDWRARAQLAWAGSREACVAPAELMRFATRARMLSARLTAAWRILSRGVHPPTPGTPSSPPRLV